MGNDKLLELENVTNRIIGNLQQLENNTVTSDMQAQIDQINKDISKQNQLLSNSDVSKSMNKEQLNRISSSLEKQKNITQNLGFTDMTSTLDTSNKLNDIQDNKLAQTKTLDVNQNGAKADIGLGFKLAAVSVAPQAAIGIGKGIQDAAILSPVPYMANILGGIGYGIEKIGELAQATLKMVEEWTNVGNKFGDKFQEYTGEMSDIIKTTNQSMGLISTQSFGNKLKSDQIAKNIIDSSTELATKIGVAFSPKQIAEFQKTYSDISSTSLNFSKSDYEVIGEIQSILDLSAQESAEMVNTFIDLGSDVDKVSDFFVSLVENSNKSGVQAKSILKDVKSYVKASNLDRFHGGVDDMSKIMAYSKRVKVDLAGMFKLMDSVSEPEEAIDLAQQLQALDINFLGLDPIDLMTAAMNDVDKFGKMIMDPIRKNIDKYFDTKTGQVTQYGAMFTRTFMQFKGIDQVFGSANDFSEFLLKASKESEVRKQLMDSAESYAALGKFTPSEQDNIIGAISSKYEDAKYNGKDIGSMTFDDLKKLITSGFQPGDSKTKIQEAAKGAMGISDQQQINENIVKSFSWTVDAINTVTELFSKDEYIKVLISTGKDIMDIGRSVMNDKMYKQIQVLTDHLGMNIAMAYVYSQVLSDNTILQNSENLIASAYKGGIEGLVSALKTVGLASPSEFEKTEKTTKKARGGTINTPKFNQPTQVQSTSKISSPSVNNQILFNLLSSFTTNKYGPGILSQSTQGTTNVIISGEIRNKINERDSGMITGEKVLEVLKEKIG